MNQQSKMVTLFKGLLLDDWRIYEYEKTIVVCDASDNRAFIINQQQLQVLRKKILLSKKEEPTRNRYTLMVITKNHQFPLSSN